MNIKVEVISAEYFREKLFFRFKSYKLKFKFLTTHYPRTNEI